MSDQQLTRAQITTALSVVIDPHTEQPLAAPQLKSFQQQDQALMVVLELGYPAQQYADVMVQRVRQALSEIFAGQVLVDVVWHVQRQPVAGKAQAIAEVKNIIAVASGKGGVGKSTTAVNLALAMMREGARVGLLDADIYGPSQGMMLGIADGTKPEVFEGKWMQPIEAYGLQVMSMAFLTTEKTPVAWRGPMASGALQQLLTQTQWDQLDYLVVDMPPGTGDIQLTLAQNVPATGSVIVTTPQNIALLDAQRGIEMFQKVRIPVLGVIENMATHICGACGHEESIFGAGGGERLSEEYQVQVLASLPLNRQIREQTDNGAPTVVSDPDSVIAQHYQLAARKLMASIALLNADAPTIPSISVTDD